MLPGISPRERCDRRSLTLHRATRTFDRVALFLAVSEFVRAKHIEAGFDPDRIRVKPNFVPAGETSHRAWRAFVVVGRLTREKGVDTLLRSWGRRPWRSSAMAIERAALEQIAPSSVRFRGAVSCAEVSDLLAGARALLIPSRSEGQPRVVVEAFAAGVPVIASRVGGLPELVEHDVNGLLVDVDDEDAWRAASEQLADDAESIAARGGRVRAWERRYSPASGSPSWSWHMRMRSGFDAVDQAGRRRPRVVRELMKKPLVHRSEHVARELTVAEPVTHPSMGREPELQHLLPRPSE